MCQAFETFSTIYPLCQFQDLQVVKLGRYLFKYLKKSIKWEGLYWCDRFYNSYYQKKSALPCYGAGFGARNGYIKSYCRFYRFCGKIKLRIFLALAKICLVKSMNFSLVNPIAVIYDEIIGPASVFRQLNGRWIMTNDVTVSCKELRWSEVTSRSSCQQIWKRKNCPFLRAYDGDQPFFQV